MSVKIPAFDNTIFVNKEGYLSDIWLQNLTQLYAALRYMSQPYNGTLVTSATTNITVNTVYITNQSGLSTFVLPASMNTGEMFRIMGFSTGFWKITQNAGQQIRVGGSTTTRGVTGSITSTVQGDCIEIYCALQNTDFIVSSFSPLITDFTVA